MYAESKFGVILHSKIELKCTADAFPTPRILWYRLDFKNKEVDLVLTQAPGDPRHGILEKNVTRDDDGKWRCRASNNFGGQSSDFIVTVIGKHKKSTVLM